MTICDVCGDEMSDKGQDVVGIQIMFDYEKLDNTQKDNIQTKRILSTFGKTEFNICFCCWLKSLGVKPINKQFDIGKGLYN